MIYTLTVREEGSRLKQTKLKFNSMSALQSYIKDRWQGVDYMDGPDGFHTDYCTYDLRGCTLHDLGNNDPDDFYSWIWKDLS